MLRKFLLVALIVFVPVQSWAVTSMGLQLDQPTMQHAQSFVSLPIHACHQNEEQQLDPMQAHNSTADSGCSSCTLCMAIGFIQIPTQLDLSDRPHQAPLTADKTLVSISSSRLIKPPIL